MVLLGVHVLAYLRRAIVSAKEDVVPVSRASVRGAKARTFLLVGAIVAGVATAAATLPVQHHWLHLPPNHHDRDRTSAASPASSAAPPLAIARHPIDSARLLDTQDQPRIVIREFERPPAALRRLKMQSVAHLDEASNRSNTDCRTPH